MRTFLFLLVIFYSFVYSQPIITKVEKLPKSAEYDGDPKVIYKVEDKEGTSFLFVTLTEKGNFGEQGFRSEIRVYKFSDKSGRGFSKVWEIKDFNTHALMNVEWIDKVFEVGDWDGDGIVESIVIYKLSQDGMDPDFYKLICYYKDKKFAIRYEMAKEEGQGKNPKVDKTIFKLPKKVQKQIKQIWTKHVGAEY